MTARAHRVRAEALQFVPGREACAVACQCFLVVCFGHQSPDGPPSLVKLATSTIPASCHGRSHGHGDDASWRLSVAARPLGAVPVLLAASAAVLRRGKLNATAAATATATVAS